jgi:RHS repeat-associated protein
MQSFQLGTSRTGSFTYSGTTPEVATATEGAVTASVTYDAAGNELTGGSTSSFTYSSRNLVQSDGTNTYTYDGRGVRVLTTGPQGPHALQGPPTVTSSYSPDLHLLTQTTDDGALHLTSTDFVWLAGLPIAQADATTLRYTFTDHLGAPIIQTDPTAAITWRAEYEPYGRIQTMRTGAPTTQPLRFPGQEDSGRPESYNIFRWYRAGWGRYTQADPLNIFGGLNLYGYVEQNPLGGIDPLGLKMAPLAPIDPFGFSIYGNWCGPSWTGGFWRTWSHLTKEQRRKALPPIDALDAGCQQHDICYGRCGTANPCDPATRSQCFRDCDHILTRRAYAVGGFWGNAIGSAIDRPGARDPGPNDPRCCGPRYEPWLQPPQFTNCAVVDGKTVCAGTGI